MNETLELMMKRKSVRVFEEKPIGPEEKQAILNAAMRAPTAGNSMLYSILDVTDQTLKDKLSETCDHQPFIAKAPMVWVFLADYRRWVRKFQQAGCENIPNPRLSDLILATNDTVIAAHAACMAAESLPQFVAPVSMLVFGYPTQQQKNRPQTSRFPQKMIVMENGYHDLTEEELQEFYPDDKAQAFYNRKYISGFALEMVRSAEEILKNWEGK